MKILKKKVTRDTEGHFIMIKVSIHEKAIINIDNNRAEKYVKQNLTETKKNKYFRVGTLISHFQHE